MPFGCYRYTAQRTVLAQRARTSHVQALHHGVQLPAQSGAAVLDQLLPTSLRRRFSAVVDDSRFFRDTGCKSTGDRLSLLMAHWPGTHCPTI